MQGLVKLEAVGDGGHSGVEDGEACEVRSPGPVCVRDPETDEVSRESQ